MTVAALCLGGTGNAFAATPFNSKSPLGIELAGISSYSSEQPFLNIFKSGGHWITNSPSQWDTGEEAYLQLDGDGYPTTLAASSSDPHSPQLFTDVVVLMDYQLPKPANGPPYPAGEYVVLYDGEGTIKYGLDAKLVSSSPGRDVIDVATPSNGISLTITSTDPHHTGNYIRNIRVVQSQYEKALDSGQMFNPVFLSTLKNFGALRFMDWLDTNNSVLSSWSNRPLLSNAFWDQKGVPLEVAVALANFESADAWLNVPIKADDDYIRQMAALVHNELGKSQKVYVELSNEVWNGAFSQYAYATSQGQATFASGLGSAFHYNRNWYGMRVAQMCDIWSSVWGADSNRVVCVLGAQAANPYTATAALKCSFWSGGPCYKHHIDAVAIAPYFGGNVPSSWTSQPDGGLSSLFASLNSQNDPSVPPGGWLGQAQGWVKAYSAALAPFGVSLVAYEGGQTFENPSNSDPALTNLYIAANRDPRMGAAYTAYLNGWKAAGGGLFIVFADVGSYNQWGEWGLLENLSDAAGDPPKWKAVQSFIGSDPCWWSGCQRTVLPDPMAPLGFAQ